MSFRISVTAIAEFKLSYLVRFEGFCRDGDLLLVRSASMTLLMQPHGESWNMAGIKRGFWRTLVVEEAVGIL